MLQSWQCSGVSKGIKRCRSTHINASIGEGRGCIGVFPQFIDGERREITAGRDDDNGIITTLNPATGAVIKQGRLTGALGPHFASPVAAAGHIFFTTEAGAVVVVAPGGDFAPLAINELGEDAYATPAFADGRIYVRTSAALYAFGNP